MVSTSRRQVSEEIVFFDNRLAGYSYGDRYLALVDLRAGSSPCRGTGSTIINHQNIKGNPRQLVGTQFSSRATWSRSACANQSSLS
jgi:hypothetical protein